MNAMMTNLDLWSLQVYRGASFGALFTSYQAASTKPMIITEFGIDAYDNTAGTLHTNNAQVVADTFGSLWQEILLHRGVVSGGCVFSYSDEWWKGAGGVAVHDTTGFTNAMFPDRFANEEWWGIFGIQDNGSNPDRLQPRALFSRLQELWTVPLQSLQPALTDGRLQAVFSRRTDRRDLTYELQSEGLTNWSPIARSTRGGATTNVGGGAFSITETGSGNIRTVTVVNAAMATNVPARFNRLKTTRD
jgi:hypothetical protein